MDLLPRQATFAPSSNGTMGESIDRSETRRIARSLDSAPIGTSRGRGRTPGTTSEAGAVKRWRRYGRRHPATGLTRRQSRRAVGDPGVARGEMYEAAVRPDAVGVDQRAARPVGVEHVEHVQVVRVAAERRVGRVPGGGDLAEQGELPALGDRERRDVVR